MHASGASATLRTAAKRIPRPKLRLEWPPAKPTERWRVGSVRVLANLKETGYPPSGRSEKVYDDLWKALRRRLVSNHAFNWSILYIRRYEALRKSALAQRVRE